MQYPNASGAKYEMFDNLWDMIADALIEGYEGSYCDLHDNLFNREDYEENEYNAKNILNYYGVFDAIGEIVEFEKDNFGEVNTDFTSPVKVLNMLTYVIGEVIIDAMFTEISLLEKVWDDQATSVMNGLLYKCMGEVKDMLFDTWFGADNIKWYVESQRR